MATFVTLRHPVTIVVTDFTNPDNSHSQLLIYAARTGNKIIDENMKVNGRMDNISLNF